MNENLNSKNIDNNEFVLNIDESDYKNLIIRLQEIKKQLLYWKKQYLSKFYILIKIVLIKNLLHSSANL